MATKIKLKQLGEDIINFIKGNGGGGGALEKDIVSNVAVGAAAAGTKFPEGQTLTEFAEKLLKKDIMPTAQFIAANSGLKKKGTTVTSPLLTLKITSAGSCTINKVEILVGSSIILTENYSTSKNTYTVNANDISTNTTVQGKVYFTKPDKTIDILTYSANYTFVNESYFGNCAGIPTAIDVLTLAATLKDKKGYTGITTITNGHIVYAYPSSMGNLTSIKDGNNFEYINSYTKITMIINNETYNVYYLTDPVTGANIKQIYI